jgi:hypothetical protein
MTDSVDSSTTAEDWVHDLEPPVPGEFAGHLRDARKGPEPPGTGSLAGAAWAALARAIEKGGDRTGAFDLLAADGLLTYACERALSHEDPVEALEDLARRASSPEADAESAPAEDVG